jgi:hypothetical protein
MADERTSPETTLAILLGASDWPKSPNLTPSNSFATSAQGIEAYLVGSESFGLPAENLLNLFDSQQSPNEIAWAITLFLKQSLMRMRTAGHPARNVIIYYIGHAGFIGSSRDYFLAMHSTIQNQEGISSIRMADLARVLVEEATHLRRYIILDCCFAASAFREFQSAPLQVARAKTLDSFPSKGTALLCSSGPRDPSSAPEGEAYTMFSGALLDVLYRGDPDFKVPLSLEELGTNTWARIREKYPLEGIRPSVLSPDQREGDIADVPLFPNAALRRRRTHSHAKSNQTHVIVPKADPPPTPDVSIRHTADGRWETDNPAVNDIILFIKSKKGRIQNVEKVSNSIWSLTIERKSMGYLGPDNVDTVVRNKEKLAQLEIKLKWEPPL